MATAVCGFPSWPTDGRCGEDREDEIRDGASSGCTGESVGVVCGDLPLNERASVRRSVGDPNSTLAEMAKSARFTLELAILMIVQLINLKKCVRNSEENNHRSLDMAPIGS